MRNGLHHLFDLRGIKDLRPISRMIPQFTTLKMEREIICSGLYCLFCLVLHYIADLDAITNVVHVLCIEQAAHKVTLGGKDLGSLVKANQEDILAHIQLDRVSLEIGQHDCLELLIIDHLLKIHLHLKAGLDSLVPIDFLHQLGGEILEEVITKGALDQKMNITLHLFIG